MVKEEEQEGCYVHGVSYEYVYGNLIQWNKKCMVVFIVARGALGSVLVVVVLFC